MGFGVFYVSNCQLKEQTLSLLKEDNFRTFIDDQLWS